MKKSFLRRLSSPAAIACALPLVAAALPGCFFVGDDDDGVTTQNPTGDFPGDEDREQYIELANQLDQERIEFLGEIADEQRATGKRVYWLEFAQFAPTVSSFDRGTETVIDYTFSIGSDAYNFEASDDLVVTAIDGGDVTIFEAYAADDPGTLIDALEVDAPTDEQRWWAYAVEGDTVYYVTTGDSTILHRWVPGQNPSEVVTLEETGAEIGIFLAFGIEDGRMMFNESGRAWVLDLATQESSFVGHDTEVSGPISFDDKGAFVPTATEALYYDFATGELRDVLQLIADSPYFLNATYDDIHEYETDGVLTNGSIFYIGHTGVFQLELASGDVRPILLEPFDSDVRIEYRYPQVTDYGDLFVTGLTSESGSVGADGPLYLVPGVL